LQRQILRDWGFDGFVVSDWGSINKMITLVIQDSKQAAEIAINAGSDMDMESSAYVEHLTLVKEGEK
jgi:beta-glucosidase